MKNSLIFSLFIFTVFLIAPVLASAQEPSPGLLMPGIADGTGTYFEITDSEYFNVSLQSTEEITLSLESIPKTISLLIKASTSTNSTILTIGNPRPNISYYKYTDSYRNEEIIATDVSGEYTFAQDLTQGHHIWFQEIRSTIFLPQDCSDYGTWNENTSTCTLNQNLTQSIEISSNTTLDCNGRSVTGSGSGYGIYLGYKSNVTVKNCHVKNFETGIYLLYSFNDALINNIFSNNISESVLYILPAIPSATTRLFPIIITASL